MPGKFTALLDPSRILLQVKSTEHAAALEEVGRQLQSHPDVSDYAGFYRALVARDQLDTTTLGNGIALPHARTEHVKKIVLAVGRSATGVPFEPHGEKVKLLFVLGTPKTKPGDYLSVISTLCKLLRDPADRNALLTAPTPEAFIDATRAIETRLKL